jgi:hypothetical protein
MSEKSTPAFRPIGAPLDVGDEALEQLNRRLGVPALTQAKASPASAEPVAVRTAEKLTIELPGYLMDTLRRAAVGDRTTVRHLVMVALRASGFSIADADMVPDGRRARGKRSS